jgi:hypothetical protein
VTAVLAKLASRRAAEADAEAIEAEFDGVTARPWDRRGSVGIAADYPGGSLIGEAREVRDELLRRLRPGARCQRWRTAGTGARMTP